MEEEVVTGSDASKVTGRKRLEDSPAVQIHGLSVDRYRAIYNSVLEPKVLADLSSAEPTEYVWRVLELKQHLWTALGRPQLKETVMEDGRVVVAEILDLT